MTLPISRKFSAWTYQDLESGGSNLTTTGIEVGTKINNTNLSVYTGGCTSFKQYTNGALIDFKTSTPIYNDENFTLSAGGRFRNIFTPCAQSGELRAQLNASYPINETISIGGAIYGRGKLDYSNGDIVTSEGGWVSGSVNFGRDISASVEFQGNYNNATRKFTPMVNAGISVKF